MAGGLVIVGGGQAGFALAAKLRALKDEREITIVGAEPELPYQRPPLSKKYLMGEMAFERLLYRPASWFEDQKVTMRLASFVEKIDRAAGELWLQDGTRLPYDTLALATGATPRRLPAAVGGDLDGVFVMRSKADADQLAEVMKPGRRLLVIGGGYIGLEAAAVARTLGLDVTVIEMADRILQRVAAKETSDIMRVIHRSHDTVIREKTGLVTLQGRDGKVTGAELSAGSVIPVDLVIVGIGVTPNDILAKEAGLAVSNGITVDHQGRSSDPAIFAMGDCAELPFDGQPTRLESVQNAVDQAEAVAAVLTGSDAAYQPRPWFWSDQYDVKLQIAGFNRGYDRVVLRKGLRADVASVWYLREDRLIAVDAINDPRAYVTGKHLIESGRTPDMASVADPEQELKQLLA